MLKRIKWKLVFKSFAWLASLVGLFVLMSFVDQKKQTLTCSNIKIVIPGADNFIEIEEINSILRHSQGDLIGRKLEGVNLNEIEKSIAANPYIAFVKVYAEMDGSLFVEIKQREPVLRIITAGGQDYYVDNKGYKIPLSSNFTANVLVANGHIMEGFNGKVDTLMTDMAKQIFKVAKFIKADSLWDAQIEQLSVNTKNEIEMIPRVGNQKIILGSAKDIELKMANLLAFYQQAMPKVGWNSYRAINLKYPNQVIAEKRDSTAIKKMEQPAKLDTVLAQKNAIDSAVSRQVKEEVIDFSDLQEKQRKAQLKASDKTENKTQVKTKN